MAPELSHAEVQDLLGAYAIDAMDHDEAALVESHLLDCPRCRAEVAEHREAATLLAFSSATAPKDLWPKIAASLDETPPPLELVRIVPARRRAPMRILAAFAAAAVIVIGLLGAEVIRQNHRIDTLAAAADARGLDQVAAAAAVAPGARTVRLRSDDGQHTAGAIVLPDGHGYLVQTQLPPLSSSDTYQLWGVLDSQTISLGLLGATPGVSSFSAAGRLSALAITVERAGGALAPTKAPIVQGVVGA